jgi:hypothetical protein
MLGFTSINDVFPTIGLSIIVLTNNGDAPPDNIAKDILAKLDRSLQRGATLPLPVRFTNHR